MREPVAAKTSRIELQTLPRRSQRDSLGRVAGLELRPDIPEGAAFLLSALCLVLRRRASSVATLQNPRGGGAL